MQIVFQKLTALNQWRFVKEELMELSVCCFNNL